LGVQRTKGAGVQAQGLGVGALRARRDRRRTCNPAKRVRRP